MKRTIACAALLGAVLAASATAQAQNVEPENLKAVGVLVTQREGRTQHVPVGTAFFVEVPSKAFPGQSFVYLVTAKHNLVESDGSSIEKLWLQIEDSRGSWSREEPLPDSSQWIFDPVSQGADVAALPFSPNNASFETIPLSRFLNASKETTIPPTHLVGGDAYYVTTVGAGLKSVPVTRFGRVSVANPARVEVTGAGLQNLYFLEGASAPELSGAPVFLRTTDDAVFWGLLESKSGDPNSRQFAGLLGVLPSSYVAETVQAMAQAQEPKTAGAMPLKGAPAATPKAPAARPRVYNLEH